MDARKVFARLWGRGPAPNRAAAAANGPADAGRSPADGTVALVPISFGELIDKMTILEIKAQRIKDPAPVANVRHELALLAAARARFAMAGRDVEALEAELMRTNETLWDIED